MINIHLRKIYQIDKQSSVLHMKRYMAVHWLKSLKNISFPFNCFLFQDRKESDQPHKIPVQHIFH